MGGGLFNFMTGDRFVNPGKNLTCPLGGFSVWAGLQGMGDTGATIAAYDADMSALDR